MSAAEYIVGLLNGMSATSKTTADRLAQLVEYRTTVREVVGYLDLLTSRALRARSAIVHLA